MTKRKDIKKAKRYEKEKARAHNIEENILAVQENPIIREALKQVR